jgi:hypothetical protein
MLNVVRTSVQDTHVTIDEGERIFARHTLSFHGRDRLHADILA